jgi:hypothetical protein
MFYLFVILSVCINILRILKKPLVKLIEWFDSQPNPFTSISGIIAGFFMIFKGIQEIILHLSK